jgi:predicted transcriptional regulator
MSPRAAWRLETLGFTDVYEYTAGEADWLAYGLPMEGANASIPHVRDIARPDIPRCTLSERMGDVQPRVAAAGWDRCVVVNPNDIVLGLLRPQELVGDPDGIVEAVMRSGPTTYRPDTTVADAAQQLVKRNVAGVLVARSDGTLLGWLRREDAERVAGSETVAE